MAWHLGVVLMLLSMEGWPSNAVEYKMDGVAYIVYSLASIKTETSSPKSYQPMIHMLFRTTKPSCLLIHGRGKGGDFFTLELVRGKLRYASVFDSTGSRKPGYYDVTVGDDLGDDQWHQIDIERRGNHVVIKLDITKKYLSSKNARKSLNINLDVSVGGLRGPSMGVPPDPSLPNITLTGTTFEGCLEDVTYDKENILQATKEKSKHIKVTGNLRPKCSEDKEYFPPATLTTSSSFIRLNIAGRQDLNLKFKFRTFEHSGILVHHSIGSHDNASLLLELIGGKLRLNFSSKFFKTDANISPKTPSFANGLWHKIELNFSNEEITVQINNEVFQKLLNVSQRVRHLSTNAVLSIGSELPAKNSIIGCIKEIDLNGVKNVIVTPGMTKNVFIDKCYLIDRCFSNPCLNNGRCLQYNNTVQCDCLGTGYDGLQCEVKKVLVASKCRGSFDTDFSWRPLRTTPMRSIAQSITTNIPQEFSVRQTKSLINQTFPSTVTLPLNLVSKNGSKPIMNIISSLTSKHVMLSSSKPTIATTTRSFKHPTYTTIISSASSVNNFQATTVSFPVSNTITPLLTSSVTDNVPSSVGVVKIPTAKQTTRKNDQRVIIIEKRNEVTTVGLNKHQWLVYLFLCVVFLLLVGFIVIISVKISRLPLCGCLKRSSLSGRESLSRQDAMEFDQHDAKEDIDSGIHRSDSGVASNRSSAEVNEETAEQERDAEIWLDCEVTILESSNESFKQGFLVLQEGLPLYTQQTFGWSVMESSDRINQPHHDRLQSDNETSHNDYTGISTNVEDDIGFVTSPEQRHATTRYQQLCGEDSSSLENVYIDMKQFNSKQSEEDKLCR